MRVLLIKMSSMGDILHTLPALTDARAEHPDIRFDWIVEAGFAEIPTWHPAVERVFPIRLRQWRRQLWSPAVWRQMRQFFAQVAAAGPYDLILDAQGLLKSAFVAKKAQKALYKQGVNDGEKNGLKKNWGPPPIWGMDHKTAREGLAARFYDHPVHVPVAQHAITRLRQLFAAALDYSVPPGALDYGVCLPEGAVNVPVSAPYWVFLHGTTWETKLWPQAHWRELIRRAAGQGVQVVLPWGSEAEYARSRALAQGFAHAVVPPERLSLSEMAQLLRHSQQVVAVDTGLAHLAAALAVPTLVLYRVTDPQRVGALGPKVKHLCSPLARQYIKRFTQPAQEQASLQGLEVDTVWRIIS
ncbi:MAG TPA: lipopolysaccharide heptosyltransferase I [Sulfurivirga caldicuralii]|nr:lipopolysaccharide heptosyltransferase I [Sulfurivirga caldicuralii]